MESLRHFGSGFLLQSSYLFMVSAEINDMIGFARTARASGAGVGSAGGARRTGAGAEDTLGAVDDLQHRA